MLLTSPCELIEIKDKIYILTFIVMRPFKKLLLLTTFGFSLFFNSNLVLADIASDKAQIIALLTESDTVANNLDTAGKERMAVRYCDTQVQALIKSKITTASISGAIDFLDSLSITEVKGLALKVKTSPTFISLPNTDIEKLQILGAINEILKDTTTTVAQVKAFLSTGLTEAKVKGLFDYSCSASTNTKLISLSEEVVTFVQTQSAPIVALINNATNQTKVTQVLEGLKLSRQLYLSNVGNRVWIDTNLNGLLEDGTNGSTDEGELGLDGVVLELLNTDDSPVLDIDQNPITSTSYTGATNSKKGYYNLKNIVPGNYKVKITLTGDYSTSPKTGAGKADDNKSDADADKVAADTITVDVEVKAAEVINSIDFGINEGDTTPPVFESLEVKARDASNTDKIAIDGKFYLKLDEKIYFTLNTNPADTLKSGSNFVGFTIGADSKESGNFSGTGTPRTTSNKNYKILAGENGDVSLTGVTFFDANDNEITSVPATFDATNIIVDTTAPVLAFTDDVDAVLNEEDTIIFTFEDDNLDTDSLKYVLTTNTTCDDSTDFTTAVATTDLETTIVINADTDNGKFICLQASDKAGNISFLKSTNALNIGILDAEIPVITLTGANPLNLLIGDSYTEEGATATDDIDSDADITTAIVVTGTVDTAIAGAYEIKYNATDSSGKDAVEVVRTVNVTEAIAPNGDGNGDGTPDVQQDNVQSQNNPETGAHTTLEVVGSTCTTVDNFSVVQESSLTVQDLTDYPVGLNDFQLSGCPNGSTVQVKLYYDKIYNTSLWQYKKYNNNVYTDFSSNAVYGTQNVNGTVVTTITITLTDNQNGDTNSTLGIIEDPSGSSLIPQNQTSTSTEAGSGSKSYSGQTKAELYDVPGAPGTFSTYAESLAYAEMMNKGSKYKVKSYTNSNGFSVFRGYQSGRLALNTFKRYNGADYVVFRGSTKENSDLFIQKEKIKKIFKQEKLEVAMHDPLLGKLNMEKAVERVTTKKVSQITNFKPVGYRKNFNAYKGLQTRKLLLENKINKFERQRDLTAVRESRIKRKSLRGMYLGVGKKKVSTALIFAGNNF